MKSIFTNKNKKPNKSDLEKALGDRFAFWNTFIDYTKKINPDATEEWVYSSEKFGWSFRVSDHKRVLIYLLPRDGFFKTAFVFGEKATDAILDSSVAESIKTELKATKKYGEGRGIRIDVKDKSNFSSIKKLIQIKTAN